MDKKRILLIDKGDPRRDSRVEVLLSRGYEVVVESNHVDAHELDEGSFDLVIVAMDDCSPLPAMYSDALGVQMPKLPILLLTDSGVCVPTGTLAHSLEAGSPMELVREVASMLTGSTHLRELTKP